MSAVSASRVRQGPPPGPMPTTASRPCARPTREATIGAADSASATVAPLDLRLGRMRRPPGPQAASAEASATPATPTSARTASEGETRCGSSAPQRRGIEEAGGNAEAFGQRVDRRLRRLEVEGGDEGDGAGGDARLLQRLHGKVDEFFRRAAARAAGAERHDGGVVDETVRVRRTGRVGDLDGEPSVVVEGQAARPQPFAVALRVDEAGGTRRQEPGHEALRGFGVGEAPALRRGVDGKAEADVARRRDRGVGAQMRGQMAGEVVGAPVPAEERHDRAARLVDGEHGRFAPLVDKGGCQEADEDPGGADADDGPAGEEGGPEMGAEVAAVGHVAADPLRRQDEGVRDRLLQAPGERQRRGAGGEDEGAAHAGRSPRRTREK